jgi:hypothetical protein
MTDEWKRIRKKAGRLIERGSRNYPEDGEQNREITQLGSRCPGRSSKRAPPEYESGVLPLRQSVPLLTQ